MFYFFGKIRKYRQIQHFSVKIFYKTPLNVKNACYLNLGISFSIVHNGWGCAQWGERRLRRYPPIKKPPASGLGSIV